MTDPLSFLMLEAKELVREYEAAAAEFLDANGDVRPSKWEAYDAMRADYGEDAMALVTRIAQRHNELCKAAE